MTLRIPQHHGHPGDPAFVGRSVVAATVGREHAAGRSQPSAAIMCRDLSFRSAWRTVVSLRSWRDVIVTSIHVYAVAPSAMTRARSGAVRSAVGQLYTVIKHAV
jgi:hypothetical protein